MPSKRASSAVMAALFTVFAPATLHAETVAVTAARMIDVTGRGSVLEKPVVVITDGRITAVGREGQTAIPAGAKRIDLPGMTLLPGLIDSHVHLTSEPTIGGYRSLEYTDSFWQALGVGNARRTLEAGFTTVRNLGSGNYDDVGLKQAIDGGFIAGPRIIPATFALGATGGHCDDTSLPPSIKTPTDSIANSPDEFRALVRRNHKYGAEVIKICGTGGVLSKGDTVGGQQLTLAEMKAIVEEAHMLHMRVAVHAHGAEGINDALRAGVDTIEHASLADEESFRLAKAGGAWFSMDVYVDDYILSEGEKNGVYPESLAKEKEVGLKQRQTFQAALKSGVKLIFGTDAGVYPHGTNALQFATMVQWGMTPMQAIQAATFTAGQALGREADVGAIAVGRYGDMIAVAADPLADITSLQHVAFVMKGGAVVKGP